MEEDVLSYGRRGRAVSGIDINSLCGCNVDRREPSCGGVAGRVHIGVWNSSSRWISWVGVGGDIGARAARIKLVRNSLLRWGRVLTR